MSVAISIPFGTSGTWGFAERRPGFSSDASRLSENVNRFAISFLDSATGQRRILEPLEKLAQLQIRCSKENWDSEGASAIPPAAFYEAEMLLSALPSYLLEPEILPEPVGAIAFEWYRGKERVFVFSVSGRKSIEFAGLLGHGNEVHGRVNFEGFLPNRLLQDIAAL